MVEKRLGSLSQRLSASVGQRRINTDLAGDAAATQSTRETQELVVKTPGMKSMMSITSRVAPPLR